MERKPIAKSYSRRKLLKTGAGMIAGAAVGTSLWRDMAAAAGGVKKFEGVTVNSVFVSGEHDDTLLRDRIADVKEKLGINLTVTDLGAGAMHDKIAEGLRSGHSPYDVSTIVGFWLAEMVGPGSFEPLEKYLHDPSLTPADFDFGDFVPKHLDYISYWNLAEHRNGRPGQLFLLPGPHSDAHMVVYRKDLFDKYGVSAPPKTWDQYVQVARKLHHPADGVYGTAFVGKLDPSISLSEWGNRLVSVGGRMFTGSLKEKTVTPHLDSPESVAALENMVELLAYSPPGVSGYALTEVADAMSAGRIGMTLMWVTVAGRAWAPNLSKVAGTVGAAVPPGNGVTIRGGWGMGIPKDVKNKEAAWAVIRYYSTKEADKARVLNYGTAAVRTSTFRDPDVVKAYPYYPVFGTLLENATPYPSLPFPESWEMVMEPSKFWNLAVVKQLRPKEACQKAQDAVQQILKKGGWNKSA
ncbi:MAG TPA: sugar ABC transporter substrate-binding protein [bacterium]|nr:sugar ABC transporter substrate-binding protein [bacterium]